MKCLFIGGPKAGCVIDVDSRARNAMIPTRKTFGEYSRDTASLEVDDSFAYLTYYRQSMTDVTGKEHFVFVASDCDPLLTLMNFYVEAHKQ